MNTEKPAGSVCASEPRAIPLPGATGGRLTQNDRLMAALMQGAVLTPLTALTIAGTLRLSERIRELEAQGVPINHERVQVGSKHVMSYKLGSVNYG